MSKVSSLEDQIKSLSEKGISRKTIAKQLNTTEWKVRTTVRSLITENATKRERKQKGTGILRLASVKKLDKATKTAVVLNDIHIPYHDQKALAVAIAYMQDINPDDIILNGDIIDFYNASSYKKDPARLHTLQDELNETKAFLKLLRTNHPTANIYYTEGNHETRLERLLLDKVSELVTLDCLDLSELLDFRSLNITYLDSKQQVSLGALEVFHGNIIRGESGASARSHFLATGGSILMGHVHRLGVFYKTNRYGVHTAIENGFLGRMDFEYTDRPNWQQGFSTISYTEDGRFSVKQHLIEDGSLIVDGVIYNAE